MPRHEVELPPLRDRREKQRAGKRREGLADADARPGAEREVGEGRDPLRAPLVPSLGTELLGVGVPAGVAVDDPGRDQHHRAGRDHLTRDLVVHRRGATDHPGRRIQAQRLQVRPLDEPQTRDVRGGRRTTLEDRVDLGEHPLADRRMLGKRVPGPGHRVRPGLVAGDHEREDLVAELSLAHGVARRVLAGAQQPRQDVGPVGALRASLADDAGDRLVEAVQDLLELLVLLRGDLVQEPRVGRRDAREPVQARGERPRRLPRLIVCDVGVQDRLGEDGHREQDHRIDDVHDLAGPPFVRDAARALDHESGVVEHPVVVEHRLDRPALRPVQVALAGEQSLADQPLRLLKGRALHEGPVMSDEDVLDVVGMTEHEQAIASERHARDVAVLARRPCHRVDRVGPKSPKQVGRGFGVRGALRHPALNLRRSPAAPFCAPEVWKLLRACRSTHPPLAYRCSRRCSSAVDGCRAETYSDRLAYSVAPSRWSET